MTVEHLKSLLASLDETYELVLAVPAPGEAVAASWLLAEREAGRALTSWNEHGGADAYAVYRAAADRASAAQDALARQSAR